MNRAKLKPLPIRKYAITTVDVEEYLQSTIQGLSDVTFSIKPVKFGKIVPMEMFIIPTQSALNNSNSKNIGGISYLESITKFGNSEITRLSQPIIDGLTNFIYSRDDRIFDKLAWRSKTMNNYEESTFVSCVNSTFDIRKFNKSSAFYVLLNPYTIFVDMLWDEEKTEESFRRVLITDCKIYNNNRSAIYIVEETTDPSFKLNDISGVVNATSNEAEKLVALEKVLKASS